jgi:PAS domain S-box-containing protein
MSGNVPTPAAAVLTLLTATPEHATLRDAESGLRAALRDPSLRIGRWDDDRQEYLDVEGDTFAPAEGSTVTSIDYDDRPVARIAHDPALLDEPELMSTIAVVARMGLEKDRVEAELRNRVEELERERNFVEAVVNTAPAYFCVLYPDNTIERYNETMAEASGETVLAPVRGRPFWEVFVDEDHREEVRDVIERRALGAHEHRWFGRSVVWRVTPLPAPEGHILVSGADVSARRFAEQALARSREFLSEVGDSTPALLLIVQEDGCVHRDGINRAVRDAFGYVASDGHRVPFWDFLIEDEEDRLRTEEIVRAAATGETPGEIDMTWVGRDGQRRSVAWTCTLMPDLMDGRRVLLVSGLDVTERKRQEHELRRSRARLVQAGDAERRRLERNLHDGAQQRLVSLSLWLRIAHSKLESEPEDAAKILATASDELGHALDELRELARGLHPALLTDRGLVPALHALCARSPLDVHFHPLLEERLPDAVEAALFYVTAEALTNVAKYAHASETHVRVARIGEHAVVEVEDDGIGGADPRGGSGLHGLADRVEALDGGLRVLSSAGRGTIVRAEIPSPSVAVVSIEI